MNDSLQWYSNELSIVTKPIPKVSNSDDVLIRVAYSGICGTDIHIISGEYPCSKKAITLGHEFCGTVEVVGKTVTHLQAGDKVVVDPNTQCHICKYCKSGQPQFCVKGRTETTIGVFKNGGWANYCRVPSYLVYKLPDNITMKNGVFVEPMSCILRGWKRLEGVEQNKNILICGAGIIGLLWASFLHYKGYRNITLSEISENRRNLASDLQLGFEVVHPDYLQKQFGLASENGNTEWGFDVVIDCSGSPQAIQQAFDWVRFGAKFLCFGVAPKDAKIEINPFLFFFRELKLIGSLVNPYTFESGIGAVQNMDKYLDFKKLGVTTYTLQDYPAALECLKEGQSSKSVFKMDFNEE